MCMNSDEAVFCAGGKTATNSGGAGGGNEGAGPGPGIRGSGGPDQTVGGAGTNEIVAGDDVYWRSLVNQVVYGSGGGGGQSSGDNAIPDADDEGEIDFEGDVRLLRLPRPLNPKHHSSRPPPFLSHPLD